MKKKEHLKDKVNDLETVRDIIRDIYRGIKDLRRAINLKDENYVLRSDFHNIYLSVMECTLG
jgi:hypothetical protein